MVQRIDFVIEETIQTYLWEVHCLEKIGDKKTAFELLEEIHALYPNNPKIVSLLGERLLDQGKYGLASKLLEEAVKLKPNSKDCLLDELADFYQEDGEYKKAEVIVLAILEVEPNYVPALRKLQDIYQEQGKKDQVLEEKLRRENEKLKREAYRWN